MVVRLSQDGVSSTSRDTSPLGSRASGFRSSLADPLGGKNAPLASCSHYRGGPAAGHHRHTVSCRKTLAGEAEVAQPSDSPESVRGGSFVPRPLTRSGIFRQLLTGAFSIPISAGTKKRSLVSSCAASWSPSRPTSRIFALDKPWSRSTIPARFGEFLRFNGSKREVHLCCFAQSSLPAMLVWRDG